MLHTEHGKWSEWKDSKLQQLERVRLIAQDNSSGELEKTNEKNIDANVQLPTLCAKEVDCDYTPRNKSETIQDLHILKDMVGSLRHETTTKDMEIARLRRIVQEKKVIFSGLLHPQLILNLFFTCRLVLSMENAFNIVVDP
jgi:hypothetical protein